jgi:flavodoxin
MNTAVRFFTRSGNTKKLASAIGAALARAALSGNMEGLRITVK